MREKISGFEREKIAEQSGFGKSPVDISKHLGVKLCLVKRVLKEMGSADTPLPPSLIYIGLKIKNLEDLKGLIILTIEKVGNKFLDPKIANSVFCGTSQLSGIFKDQEMEGLVKRVEGIEKVLKNVGDRKKN